MCQVDAISGRRTRGLGLGGFVVRKDERDAREGV